jgi:hypothetical protein
LLGGGLNPCGNSPDQGESHPNSRGIIGKGCSAVIQTILHEKFPGRSVSRCSGGSTRGGGQGKRDNGFLFWEISSLLIPMIPTLGLPRLNHAGPTVSGRYGIFSFLIPMIPTLGLPRSNHAGPTVSGRYGFLPLLIKNLWKPMFYPPPLNAAFPAFTPGNSEYRENRVLMYLLDC